VTAVLVARFAIAIVFDALAFVVWDVGTRPPRQLARDVARGARIPRVLAGGVVRLLVGAALLLLAALVARPGIPSMRAFTIIETGMLIAALVVENLIGPDLRGRLRARR
jgi:hypothetical protein